jgi:hypothetical protein
VEAATASAEHTQHNTTKVIDTPKENLYTLRWFLAVTEQRNNQNFLPSTSSKKGDNKMAGALKGGGPKKKAVKKKAAPKKAAKKKAAKKK